MLNKINTLLSVLMTVVFLLHGVMGSFKMMGVGNDGGKIFAWIGMVLLLIHVIFGIILTVQTIKVSKEKGENYLKQNSLFWVRRLSGFAILIMLFFHIGLFGRKEYGQYILLPFTEFRFTAQMLFIASVFVHLFVNIRPLMVALGVIKYKERKIDIFLILSVFLLFFCAASVIYYIGWQP